MNRKRLVLLSAIALVAASGWYHLTTSDTPATRAQLRSGRTVELTLEGDHPTILHFWASWCGPCRHELPTFVDYAQQQKALGYRVQFVSLDRDWSAIDGYMRDSGLIFDTLLDPKGNAARRWMVGGIPTTIVVGGDGKELGRFVGSRDWSSDRQRLQIAELVK